MKSLVDLKNEIAKRGEIARNYVLEMGNKYINPVDPLREAALHYLKGGGKGFRPAMMQLVCGSLGGNEQLALAPAAAIESIHVSSLIHDDFMDRDLLRRGLTAVWKQWNPTIAILAGDVLFGLAFSIVGEIKGLSYDLRYAFTKELGQIYMKLCEGQMYDIGFETREINSLTVDDVTNMQYLKTGVLFEYSCVTGARIALNKLEDPIIDIVRNYARLAGTAFQIQDDIIGLIGKEEEIGKPVGSDIREGKRTLIAIYAFLNASDLQKDQMLKGFGNSDASKEDIDLCLKTMFEIGSIDNAKKLAEQKARKAIDLTSMLPQNQNTEILAAFAKYMVDRAI